MNLTLKSRHAAILTTVIHVAKLGRILSKRSLRKPSKR